MKIAVTGGTGFVGSRLIARLQRDCHDVVLLTRDASQARRLFPASTFPNVSPVAYTPTASGPWQKVVSGCDGVVNLAGAPIAERWTPVHKQAIFNSRKLGTERLVEAIAQAEQPPKVCVSASAIGFYGSSETAAFDETSPPAEDNFLSEVCRAWETAAQQVTQVSGVRLVIPRIGIVLGNGGALGRMLPPFRLFAGGPIGSGRQWFSWVHIDDLVAILLRALTDPSMQGIYNATGPQPVRMDKACDALGSALGRPSWLPVPDFAIETLLGDGAIVVLEGQQVFPKKLLSEGFPFQYATVEQAMKAVVAEL